MESEPRAFLLLFRAEESTRSRRTYRSCVLPPITVIKHMPESTSVNILSQLLTSDHTVPASPIARTSVYSTLARKSCFLPIPKANCRRTEAANAGKRSLRREPRVSSLPRQAGSHPAQDGPSWSQSNLHRCYTARQSPARTRNTGRREQPVLTQVRAAAAAQEPFPPEPGAAEAAQLPLPKAKLSHSHHLDMYIYQ